MTIKRLDNVAPAASTNNAATDQQKQYATNRGANANANEDRSNLATAFGDIRSATRNTLGTSGGATRGLSALHRYLTGYIDSKVRSKELNFKTVIVEKGVAVPSVVVLQLVKDIDAAGKPIEVIFGHAILIIDYSVRPKATFTTSDGKYESTTVWADAHDKEYIARIQTAIVEQLGINEFEYVDAGCTGYNGADLPIDKLTNDVNYQDGRLDNLTFTVMTGVEATRAMHFNDQATFLQPAMATEGKVVVADINLTPTSSTTPAGLPVAEDFMIRVRETNASARRTNSNDGAGTYRSLNDTEAESDFAYGGVSGRIDFTYVTPQEPVRDPRPEDSASFFPDFIISGFDVYDRSPSLSMLLQLISSVGILDSRSPAIYLNAFKPENIIGAPSRNLGALGAELVDFKTGKESSRAHFRNNTTEDTYYKFIRAAILPVSRIGIEVPTQGPLIGLIKTFERAAMYALTNDKAYADDEALLIEAADILTDGKFSDIWQGQTFMAREIAAIPGGWWVDDNGEKRDSREFGYLFYGNLENPKEAKDMSGEYLDSFNHTDSLIAANIRKKLITEVKGTNFVQTDNFARCFFAPETILALNEALRGTGLAVESPNMNFHGRGNERRRVDGIAGIIRSDALEGAYSRHGAYERGANNRTYGRYADNGTYRPRRGR